MEIVSREELIEYFSYLDRLRQSGVTNMFGASPYIQEEFGVSRRLANSILSTWMKTFSEEDVNVRADKFLEEKSNL